MLVTMMVDIVTMLVAATCSSPLDTWASSSSTSLHLTPIILATSLSPSALSTDRKLECPASIVNLRSAKLTLETLSRITVLLEQVGQQFEEQVGCEVVRVARWGNWASSREEHGTLSPPVQSTCH